MNETRTLAILIFDDVEVLDFCGPFEVFSVANRFTDPPAFNVLTVAEKAGPVLTRGGLSVNPHHRLADCPQPDLLLVPGGQGTRKEMHNPVLIDWIRQTATKAELLACISHHEGEPCSGGGLVGSRDAKKWFANGDGAGARGRERRWDRLAPGSALLTVAGEFRVSYWHRLATKPSSLRLAIRTPGEQRPRTFLNVPNKESGTATVNPPDSVLKDAHGTILASLVAEVGDERVESPPIWVIQEGRLTYESSGEGSSSAKSKVEESGEGLTEFLEELGKRDGVSAVVESCTT